MITGRAPVTGIGLILVAPQAPHKLSTVSPVHKAQTSRPVRAFCRSQGKVCVRTRFYELYDPSHLFKCISIAILSLHSRIQELSVMYHCRESAFQYQNSLVTTSPSTRSKPLKWKKRRCKSPNNERSSSSTNQSKSVDAAQQISMTSYASRIIV